MSDTRRPVSPGYQAPDRDGEPVREPATNARQGVTGHNVRYVLAVSTVVVIALFAIIYFIFFAG